MLLLHHLLLHGSDRVVRAAQDRLYEIRSLQDYHVIYEPGFNLDAIIPPSGTETKDGELNVRVKAKELVELIQVHTYWLWLWYTGGGIYIMYYCFSLPGRRETSRRKKESTQEPR